MHGTAALGHAVVLVAAALAGGYLVGSIPVAWLVVRRGRGVDLRRTGRGQAGALDALVVGGMRAAALTVALELVKGAVVGLGARLYDNSSWFAATAIAGCVVGDAFPIGIRRGRRGLAPLVAGVVAAIPAAWWAGLIIALPGVVLVGPSPRGFRPGPPRIRGGPERGSAFEQLVALCVPLGLLIGSRDPRTLGPAAIIVVALIARHRLRARHHRLQARRWTELGDPGTPPLAVEQPPGGGSLRHP